MVKILSYRVISDGEYLSADTNYMKNDENLKNVKTAAILLLIYWILALPIAFVSIYKLVYNEIKFNKVLKVFGFLIKEYKISYYYWEVLKNLFIKLSIIMIIEFADNDIIYRTVSIILICFSYYLLLTHF